MTALKLQHHLAKAGIFSRRGADAMIKQGYVRVNGVVIHDSLHRIDPAVDCITFTEAITDYAHSLGYVLIHKPRGVWTNNKQHPKDTEVRDILPPSFATYSSIGRLDKDSEGLILFTNDGVFANGFLNAGDRHERVYMVQTKRPLTPADIKRLMAGVRLSDGWTQPCTIQKTDSTTYRFTLIEGKNRQIRRMVESCRTQVARLKRIQFGPYELGDLPVGGHQWQSLQAVFMNRISGLPSPL